MKVGFVVLVGRSNVGKSTLLNALVGTKISITTDKPQTTRRAIQGVRHEEGGQIVFVDTPGIFQKRGDSLSAKLNRAAESSLEGVDVLVYVVDATRAIGPEEERVLKIVKNAKIPTIFAINKIDEPNLRFIDDYRALSPDFAATVEISAMKGSHLKTLVKEIMSRLPEGEPVYPEHQVTNLTNEEWYAELIREKVFLALYQELPYTAAVEVDAIEDRLSKDGTKTLYIQARVLTDDEKHKRMIIGAGGKTIKQIGSATRKEVEAIIGKKVFLDLEVDVDPHWPERLA